MLRAKDIMTKKTISVKPNTPVYEALELAVKHGISGMPVVKDDLTLTAILSEKDLVKLFYDKEDAQNKTVTDYMTQPAVHFEENESLVDICDFLIKNIFRRVPITSNGKLVGIISIRDILAYVLELRDQASAAS